MISIILPTYKHPPHLARAIESVLRQTYTSWELIVVDDGLSEPSVVVEYTRRDPRIVYIKNESNQGIQRSLNTGLRYAKGIYIARIDDDDEWIDTEKLAKQITFLQNHSDYVLIGTNATIVDEKGNLLGTYQLPETDGAIRSRILSKNCFLHPTVIFRKDAADRIGGYDESLQVKHIEDYALWLALGQVGKYANLPDTTTKLMVHPHSLTAKNRILQARHMWMISKQYRHLYPGYFRGRLHSALRVIGFSFFKIVPVPKKMLYFVQGIYKKL